jgi:hypothetical protein
MKFKTAAAVENVVWQMRLADWPRARNRARINDLFNGAPPYSEEAVRQNGINTNVNSLEAPHESMAARGQFGNALVTPDPLINIELDYGPVYKRRDWANTISREINKKIKNSLAWQEEEESTFAQVVLHGIGPAHWEDRYCPYPKARGIEDVLIPSETLRSMENSQMVAIYRSWTAAELYKLTHGPRTDKGWNLPLVDRAITWVDQEAMQLYGTKWPEIWSPEKMAERIKEDSGLYSSDAMPTVDAFDVYYWDESGKHPGWKRKVILDAWGNPGVGGAGGISYAASPASQKQDGKYGVGSKSEFLYDGGDRTYADDQGEFIHFQFGDASAVAPFRYHSVRSLGFLLYAVCHLQNRLKCKLHDHVFENLIQYFRVANPADAERLSKVDLVDKGIIPEGLNFVKQDERWQINDQVAQMMVQMNQQTMATNSASFTQDFDFEKEKAEETATRTMAKVNSTSALIGSMLNRAYNYQKFKLIEVCRRFCMLNSRDPDVRSFRVECLKAGVPAEALNVERWNVQPVRVIGNGNKMLQVAMMDKIMATVYDKLDPDAQKEMVRLYIAVNSGDYELANRSVPEQKRISESVHDAQTSLGTILDSLPVTLRTGVNHGEYVEVWLHAMAMLVQKMEGKGGTTTPDELSGLNNLGQHIGAQIKILSQDKTQKENVAQYGKDLGKLMNLVKGYAQRLQEQQQKQAQAQNGQMDPKDQAKIKATLMTAQTKQQIATESHAQKTAQRQIAFQQKIHQDAIEHKAEIAKKDLETAANVRRGGMKSLGGDE